MTSSLDRLAPGILIAAPTLQDPNFEQSVILLCAHSDEGAMGLVVNRPAPLSTHDVMRQMGFPSVGPEKSALLGGPVAGTNGLILYIADDTDVSRGDTLVVSETLRLCPNSDLLKQISEGLGPSSYEVFLGHAGWGPSQLEGEIALGAWIPGDIDMPLLFEVAHSERWMHALNREGLSPEMLTTFRPHS